MRVRYEDLVRNPETEMQKVCDYLHLPFQEEMLSVGWINSTTIEEDAGYQIGTAAVGKWKNNLPAADVAVCQWVVGNELSANDYPIKSFPPAAYITFPFLLLNSVVEFFLRFYRKWRRGGIDLVRSVFHNYRLRLLRLIRP
jgi:hypothetical protein